MAGDCCTQSAPLKTQVSLVFVTEVRFSPPNRTTTCRRLSYAIEGAVRAPGECAGAICVQVPAAPSHIQVSLKADPLSPPNRITFPIAASYARPNEARKDGCVAGMFCVQLVLSQIHVSNTPLKPPAATI